MFVCMSVCALCVDLVPTEASSPRTREHCVTEYCELPHGCWDPNLVLCKSSQYSSLLNHVSALPSLRQFHTML